MTLTTDLQRSLELQQDGLTEEDLPGFDTEAPHLRLGHLDDLPRATPSDWQRGKCFVSLYCLGANASCRQIPQHILLGGAWEVWNHTQQSHQAIVKSDELQELLSCSL